MRTLATVLIASALLFPMAQAADPAEETPPSDYAPLRGSECLDPAQARGWTLIDDRQLLVDAGRHKYRVELGSNCMALSYTNNILFRGDPISQRVCGVLNDAVLTRDYPCPIERMELLNKEQYQQALKDYEAARQARKAEKKQKQAEQNSAKENSTESQTP